MAAKPSGPGYRKSCRASLPSGDHDDSLENFHPAATSLSVVWALAVALRRAMPQACMRGGGCVSFQSVLALKKIKREAAARIGNGKRRARATVCHRRPRHFMGKGPEAVPSAVYRADTCSCPTQTCSALGRTGRSLSQGLVCNTAGSCCILRLNSRMGGTISLMSPSRAGLMP